MTDIKWCEKKSS